MLGMTAKNTEQNPHPCKNRKDAAPGNNLRTQEQIAWQRCVKF
jgi:hypothetical protein